VQGAYQHILTDLYGFIGTVLAGIVIFITGYARADAIASLVVVDLMLKPPGNCRATPAGSSARACPMGQFQSDQPAEDSARSACLVLALGCRCCERSRPGRGCRPVSNSGSCFGDTSCREPIPSLRAIPGVMAEERNTVTILSKTERCDTEPSDGVAITGDFALLFDRHAGAVHRYLARRLGRGAADDLLGQTFLVAYEQRHRFDRSRSDARPWLYGIATNLVHRHQRDEVRQYQAWARTGADPLAAESHAQRVVERVDAQVWSSSWPPCCPG